jgi:hypothetical protein
MVDVAWYVNRLRIMDGRELIHRVRERLQLRLLERSQRDPAVALAQPNYHAFSFCVSQRAVLRRLEWDLAANEANADSLLEGRWPALGCTWTFIDAPNIWHRAPDTGAMWPTDYFARIDHRHDNPVGDARIVWEPSRLQQLVSLALLAARPKHRARAVARLERELASWVDANPPYRGIHYVSAMECALRLIAVCHAVDMVRGHLADPSTTWRCVIALVSSHARLIDRRLSLHSSATNHTIAEAVGLIYAGFLFPELEHAQRWRAVGRTVLNSEYLRQVLPDGGGAEQAPAYLKMVTDLAALALPLLESLAPQDSRVIARIERACHFFDELSALRHRTPTQGDSDDGFALSPYWRPPRRKAAALRLRATFPASGYTILRSRAHPAHQIVFDHGPLGLAPAHAHGHADALALTLHHADTELLIDPGTYSYRDQIWRSYFRSSSAHNTVTVDRRDQALQAAPFIWRQPFTSTLVKYEGGGDYTLLLATHDGYRLRGVQHWRGLIYDHAHRLIVWDFLTGRDDHRVSLWWHLGVDAALTGNTVRTHDGALAMRVSGAVQLSRYRASTDPIAGWRSPSYGVKEPATTIEAAFHGVLPHALRTVICTSATEALEPNAREIEHLATLQRWVDET